MATLFQFPYRTVAEISLSTLVKNLVTLRAMSQCEVIPVVKANAYGHGVVPIAKALIGRGSCRMLSVATLEEAMELRQKVGKSVSILVLSGFFPHQVEAYVRDNLVPVIHSLNHLKQLSGVEELPDIHLKLDTGMNRLGIALDEINESIRLLEKLGVKLSGIMSHFAESEKQSSSFSDIQLKKFEGAVQEFRSHRLLKTDARIHIANTGGVLRNQLGASNAIRPGIGLYGISPNPDLGNSRMLTPILSWRTRVLSIRTLGKGDTVGYGRTYKVKRRPERIALVPVGYADGYPRLLGNQGEMLGASKRLKVRGRVSMDLTAIDVTNVPSIKEGSTITIVGNFAKLSVNAWDLAKWSDTIPYEIFCGISLRVPRVYLE